VKPSEVEGSRERTKANAAGFLDFARNDGVFDAVPRKVVLEVPLNIVSMKLEIHEILLAGEARAVFLFVV
jgi:hypothetical protein